MNDSESIVEIIKHKIQHMLDKLSDGGDDWYTAEKLNELIEFIDNMAKE